MSSASERLLDSSQTVVSVSTGQPNIDITVPLARVNRRVALHFIAGPASVTGALKESIRQISSALPPARPLG